MTVLYGILIGFGSASGIIIGLITFIFNGHSRRISKIESILESFTDIKSDLEIIKSHSEGKASFAKGLVTLNEEQAVIVERLDNTIEKIDTLTEQHNNMVCKQWDGVNRRK